MLEKTIAYVGELRDDLDWYCWVRCFNFKTWIAIKANRLLYEKRKA